MRKALLIVDFQKGFGATPELAKKIQRAAIKYDVIVATEFVNGNPLYKKKASQKELTLLSLPSGTKVFKKDGYGIPPVLLNYLKRKGVTEVHIVGLETEACVIASAFNLWDARIRPHVLKSLVSSKNRNLRDPALLLIKKNFR